MCFCRLCLPINDDKPQTQANQSTSQPANQPTSHANQPTQPNQSTNPTQPTTTTKRKKNKKEDTSSSKPQANPREAGLAEYGECENEAYCALLALPVPRARRLGGALAGRSWTSLRLRPSPPSPLEVVATVAVRFASADSVRLPSRRVMVYTTGEPDEAGA